MHTRFLGHFRSASKARPAAIVRGGLSVLTGLVTVVGVLSVSVPVASASGAPRQLGESAGDVTLTLPTSSSWSAGDYIQIEVLDSASADTIGFTNTPGVSVELPSTGTTPTVSSQLDTSSHFGTLGSPPVSAPVVCVPNDSEESPNPPTCDTFDIFFTNNGSVSDANGIQITIGTPSAPVKYDISTLAANGPVTINVVSAFSGTLPSTAASDYIVNGASQTPPAPTTTKVSANQSSVAQGTIVTYTATVTSTAGTPTGTVSFSAGSAFLCRANLALSGTASCSSADAPAGTDTITATYSGDGTHLTSSGTASLTVVGHTCVDEGYTSNAAFVCQAYVDLLARMPASAEDSSWVAVLSSGTSRTEVALEIATSNEYRQDLVKNLYGAFLGRKADSNGLAFWVGTLASGGDDQQVMGGILGSAEYYSEVGSTPGAFVSSLYSRLLDRSPDASGLAYWEYLLAVGATRSAVTLGILGSGEYLSDLVTAEYSYLLDRFPDQGGLVFWVTALKSGASFESVIAGIVGSQEFFNDSTA